MTSRKIARSLQQNFGTVGFLKHGIADIDFNGPVKENGQPPVAANETTPCWRRITAHRYYLMKVNVPQCPLPLRRHDYPFQFQARHATSKDNAIQYLSPPHPLVNFSFGHKSPDSAKYPVEHARWKTRRPLPDFHGRDNLRFIMECMAVVKLYRSPRNSGRSVGNSIRYC